MEETAKWETHNLQASQNTIRMNVSRRVLQAGHVTCIRDMKNAHKIFVIQPEEQTTWKTLAEKK